MIKNMKEVYLLEELEQKNNSDNLLFYEVNAKNNK